jgi:hypothetical protein
MFPQYLPPPLPIPAKKVHHASVWQLVLGVVSLCSYLLVLLLFIFAILGSLTNSPDISVNATSIKASGIAMALFALLCVPSIVTSIHRIRGLETRVFSLSRWMLPVGGGLLLVWAGLVYLGYRLHPQIWAPALTGLMNVVVVLLPVVIWVIVGGHGLKLKSTQRGWGVYNFSQFVSVSLSMIVEIGALILAMIAAGIWLSGQAEFLPYIQQIQSQGMLTDQTITSLISDLSPLIKTPFLYAIIIGALCMVTPMIEEFIKPLAIWFFAGKELTPSEGFFMGLVCGAGFALSESLLMMSGAAGAWTSTVIGRAGTSLLHVTTPAIIGWAMAKSWHDGKYLRVSLAYLGTIVLHGIWNFFALLMGLNSVVLPIESDLIRSLMPISKWVLCGLAVVMVAVLLLINRHLQKEAKPPLLPGTISEIEITI